MDDFLFYVILVVIAALASMTCSCLWKYYRTRAILSWQEQQQQLLRCHEHQRIRVIGIADIFSHGSTGLVGNFRGPETFSSFIAPGPPAYDDVVTHPETYPSRLISSDDHSKPSDLPPLYSQLDTTLSTSVDTTSSQNNPKL